MAASGLAVSAEQASEEPTIRGRMVAAEVAVPDFTAEWEQIRQDVEEERRLTRAWGAVALRVGQNLIEIRKELKPLKLWGEELKRRLGWSQPQASRYIRFAELPEADREIWLRAKHFSLSAAVGEGRSGKNGAGANVEAEAKETPLGESERAERLAEVTQLLKLGIEVVEAGEKAKKEEVAAESGWSEEDDARRLSRVSIAAEALLAVANKHLEAELKRRLFPGEEAGS